MHGILAKMLIRSLAKPLVSMLADVLERLAANTDSTVDDSLAKGFKDHCDEIIDALLLL